ncbi:MAG: STAS domain-containing protein [Pseudomonadota bacterium]|nr:STAS domain-containing protein [Pseudomonadota bacterium]
MKITIQQNGSEWTVILEGEFGAESIENLRPEFERIVKGSGKSIEVDMTKVDFMDSSGLGALVFLFKRLRERGGALVISGLHGQPWDLLHSLRIDRNIPMRTLDEDKSSGGVSAKSQASKRSSS